MRNCKELLCSRTWSLVIGATILCIACNNNDNEIPAVIPAKLPSMVIAGSQGNSLTIPTGQAWLRSMQLVAIGEVISISLQDSPAFRLNESSYQQIDVCSGTVEPAIEIDIRVTNQIFGSASERLTFRIGTEQVLTYSPRPQHGTQPNTIVWSRPGNSNDAGIMPGDTLGFGLRQISESPGWSTMGEPLFTMRVSEEGAISLFQKVILEGDTSARIPSGIEGRTIQELIAMANDSSFDVEADRYRSEMVNRWGTSPLFYYGALCSVEEGNTESEVPIEER